MNTKKLKAFTLVEMMIVLLLSSILMGAASVLYQNVTAYHTRLRDRAEQTNTFHRLKYYLQKDISRSDAIELTSSVLDLNDGQIKYYFEADSVFRVLGSYQDAFPIKGTCAVEASHISLNFELYEQVIQVRMQSKTSARQVWNSKH